MPAQEELLTKAFAALKEKKWSEAERHARAVLRVQPTSPQALYVLGSAISDYGNDVETARLYEQAISFNSKFLAPYQSLSRTYYGLGLMKKSARLYRVWAEVEPGNPEVQHMAAAVTGEDVPAKCSERYVQAHFNQFSTNFDDVLVKRLAYKGPEIIAAALTKHRSVELRSLDVLDAGCGTGLCGPAIREQCRSLTGVDLAEKMVDQARARGCYDELVVSELCAFMEGRRDSFDAVVSSDVLIYFGALERVMSAAHTTLRPSGVFIYALEALVDSGSSDTYRLTASGRYAHRESYLHQVMCAAGFDVVSLEREFLRWERGKQVPFHVSVALKR